MLLRHRLSSWLVQGRAPTRQVFAGEAHERALAGLAASPVDAQPSLKRVPSIAPRSILAVRTPHLPYTAATAGPVWPLPTMRASNGATALDDRSGG